MMNLTNHMLIAMPQLCAEPFQQSVVYLCQHSAEGAMGLIINVGSGMVVSDVLQQLNIDCQAPKLRKVPVLIGGPMQPEYGFILHNPIGNWKSSIIVTDDIAITISKDILNAIAKNEGPAKSLFALGFAEWGPGQLEKELADNYWLTATADERILFDTAIDQRWKMAAALTGVKNIRDLSQHSGRA